MQVPDHNPLQDNQVQDIEALKRRIQTLEHALDQALLVIQDLRNQLQDQECLEQQLVATEEFAYIQEKAVLVLKHQLSQVQVNLSSHEYHSKTQIQTIEQLQEDLVLTSMKQEELENEIMQQTRSQARLQQYCQELEAERDRQQPRLQELEHQIAELQEQVLHQVQQASEYETAVQHWKYRYQMVQQGVLQLKVLIEQGEAIGVDALDALLAHCSTDGLGIEPVDGMGSMANSSKKNSGSKSNAKVELPNFLTRREL